jgi:hypothetical protein
MYNCYKYTSLGGLSRVIEKVSCVIRKFVNLVQWYIYILTLASSSIRALYTVEGSLFRHKLISFPSKLVMCRAHICQDPHESYILAHVKMK